MTGFRNAHEMDVWKLSDELRCRMREILKRPGFARHPSLKTQLEDSSESPCPNISEGFVRFFPVDNARFVRIAAGSLGELLDHLNRALACRLITTIEERELALLTRRALGAAKGYIVYLESSTKPYEDAGRRPPNRRRSPKTYPKRKTGPNRGPNLEP
jgi:four helix bundle protein